MPIYDYKCDDCEHVFEEIMLGAKDKLARCPECASMNTKKLPSAASFRLYGEGFYKRDHKDTGEFS